MTNLGKRPGEVGGRGEGGVAELDGEREGMREEGERK